MGFHSPAAPRCRKGLSFKGQILIRFLSPTLSPSTPTLRMQVFPLAGEQNRAGMFPPGTFPSPGRSLVGAVGKEGVAAAPGPFPD